MTTNSKYPVLVVAGLDSAGLSGLDADRAALEAWGVDFVEVATARTRQGAAEFKGSQAGDPAWIAEELGRLLGQGVSVVKTGMLANAAIVQALADALAALEPDRRPRVVVDPVLESTSGGELLDAQGRRRLVEALLPLADVVTPNAVELGQLLGCPAPVDERELESRGRQLLNLGPGMAYLKGGHLGGSRSVDLVVTPRATARHENDRRPGGEFRGTGCTLASSLAAALARGHSLDEACFLANRFTAECIRRALPLPGEEGFFKLDTAAAAAALPYITDDLKGRHEHS